MKHPLGCDLSTLVPAENWVWDFFKSQVRATRSRCLKRGLKHQLSVEFLVDMIFAQDFRCAVSKMELQKPNFLIGGREPFQPSIDRIDNRRGYEADNVRIVCLIVNIARNDFGDAALFKMAGAIASLA